jgi:hypothetical protein
MHRLDQAHALDRSQNFGYFEENLVVVCAGCHEARESTRPSCR